jgi:predicted LppA-like lipoprotein
MTTTRRQLIARSGGVRRPRQYLFRSGPQQGGWPVTSAGVDGFSGPDPISMPQHGTAGIEGRADILRTPRVRVRRTAPVVAALLAALLCVGCSTPGQLTQGEAMDAQAELAARPRLEEMIVRYDEMLQRIRDRLDAELGPFTWFEHRPRTWNICGSEFPVELGGRTTSSPLWAFEGNIPDDRWPRAQRIVADIAAEYGFATAGLQIDTPATPGKPGRHVTGGVDSTLGAYYDFGTNVNTSIRVDSGCHLPANPTPGAPSTGTPAMS